MSKLAKIPSDMIKPYNGEGDLVTWLKKLKLVAKLAKIEDLAEFLPLYLDGNALAIYLELTDDEQGSIDLIEKKLKEAFTDGPFVAYSKLIKMKWTGEPVDVFANEIRRLAGLAEFEGEALEKIVKLSFVNSFPESISVELQQITGLQKMTMSDVLSRARILTAHKSQGGTVSAVASVPPKIVQNHRYHPKESRIEYRTKESNVAGFKGKCFRCDGPHMARYCTEKRTITCYKCGEEGHISPNCSNPGN